MPTSTIIYTLHIVTIFSMLFSGIFIVAIRGTKPPMLYLSLDRFVSAFLCIVNIFQTSHTPIYGQVLWNPLHIVMGLTIYPLLFAYIFEMVHRGNIGVRYWLWAYVPPAVLAMLYVGFEALFGKLPLFSTYADVRNYLKLPQLWILFAAAGYSIAMISLYTVRAIGMLRQHKRNLEANFSYTEGSTLEWMWWAIAITLLKWLLLFARIGIEGNTASFVGLFLFIEPVVITVLVLRQKDLYGESAQKNDSIEEVIFDEKSNGFELSLKKREDLKTRLLLLLEKNEIFINSELNSDKVSEMLGTNRTYLSQVINNDLNTTFYQLINTYRLNKSVKMMRDPLHRNMSLKNIAEICGFKSLSAFSTFFKQEYGKTPTEWGEEESL